MRALVVGGLGFLGSHVVEKLNRENYEIGILDDRSTGKVGNVSCKTQQYRLRADDPRCQEVMRSFKADCVIYCAWRTSGAEPDLLDATGINGLDNLLRGAIASGVGRFLLTVEQECSESQAHAQQMAERLCEDYQGKQGMIIGIFRISHLYGPRMTGKGPGGLLLQWLKDAEKEAIVRQAGPNGVRLFVKEPPDAPSDWLYVSDASEAIFRFAEGAGQGIYALSADRAYTRAQIAAQISKVQDWLQQEETRPDAETTGRFRNLVPPPDSVPGIGNAAIKHDLDWVPLRNLSEGLLPTMRWHAARKRQQNRLPEKSRDPFGARRSLKKGPRTGWKHVLQLILPFAENMLAFAAVLLVEYWLKHKLGIRNVDVKIIYIVLISALFGMKQSLFAVLMSTLAYMWSEAGTGLDLISLVLDASLIVQLISYALAGLAVDIVVDTRNRRIQVLEEEKTIQLERFDFLQEMYTDMAKVKNELQQQIVRSCDSLGQIQAVARELDGTDVQVVQQKAVGVLASVLKHDRIALYALGESGRCFRCIYRSADEGFEPEKSYRIEQLGEAMNVLKGGNIHVNRNLNSGLPAMLAPVLEGRNLKGMIALYDLGFDKMNLYFQNLFLIVTGMAVDALVRAYRHEAMTRTGRFWEDTGWLNREAFDQTLNNQMAAVKLGLSTCTRLRLGFPFAAGGTTDGDQDRNADWLRKSGPLLAGILRDVDSMGLDQNGFPVVLLSNTTGEQAERAMLRIGHAGLHVTAIQPLNPEHQEAVGLAEQKGSAAWNR